MVIIAANGVIATDDNSLSEMQNVRTVYLRRTLPNQNQVHAEMSRRLNVGNQCYHLVKKLFSRLMSKNLKIKIITLYVMFCMGVELGLSRQGKSKLTWR